MDTCTYSLDADTECGQPAIVVRNAGTVIETSACLAHAYPDETAGEDTHPGLYATDRVITSTDNAADTADTLADDIAAIRHQLEPHTYRYGDPEGPADTRHGVLIRATHSDRKGPHLLVSFQSIPLPRTTDTASGYAEVTDDPYRPGEHRVHIEYVARTGADGGRRYDDRYQLVPLTDKMRETLREELAAHVEVYLSGIDSLALEHRKARAAAELSTAHTATANARTALTDARRILAGQA